MKNKDNDILDDLITRCLTGEATAEEQNNLSDWIKQGQENEHHYLNLRKAFELSKGYNPDEAARILSIDIDQEWTRFVSRVQQDKPARTLAPGRNAPTLWLRIAAAVLLILVSGIVVNYFTSKGLSHYQTFNNTLAIELPDGSEVVLNKFSELTYSKSFGDETRTVTLNGEGFFEVHHDPQKPFVVSVNNARVEVLGTSFNIQGYDTQKEVEIIVQTGIVKVSVPSINEEIRLNAGERGIYSKALRQLARSKNDDVNFISWKTGRIVFVKSDLRAVVETLNKTYGTNIVISVPLPATCAITVTFEKQDFEAVLNVLKTTLGLQYSRNGNQIEIIEAGC